MVQGRCAIAAVLLFGQFSGLETDQALAQLVCPAQKQNDSNLVSVEQSVCGNLAVVGKVKPAPLRPEQSEDSRSELVSQGFECEPVSPTRGLVCVCNPASACNGKLGAKIYQPVAIIVPPAFHPEPNPDYVYYFHGNNPVAGSDHDNLEQIMSKRNMAENLAASGRNSIMIVPLGTTVDSFTHSHMAIANNFKKFTDSITTVLQNARLVEALPGTSPPEPKSVALVSNSLGCYPSTSILTSPNNPYRDKVTEVIRLDSTYGGCEAGLKGFKGRYWSTYTSATFDNKKRNLDVLDGLPDKGSCAHIDRPKEPEALTACAVSTHRCGFIHLGTDINRLHSGHIKEVLGTLLTPGIP